MTDTVYSSVIFVWYDDDGNYNDIHMGNITLKEAEARAKYFGYTPKNGISQAHGIMVIHV